MREDREDADLKQALGTGDAGATRPKRGRPSGAPPPGYGERPPGGPRSGGGGGGGPPGGYGGGADTLVVGRRVVVEGLGAGTTWKTLKDHFRGAGGVLHADVMQVCARSHAPGGCGFACNLCSLVKMVMLGHIAASSAPACLMLQAQATLQCSDHAASVIHELRT